MRNVLTLKPTNPYSIRGSDPKFRIYISCDGQAPQCALANGIIPSAVTQQQLDASVPSTGSLITFCDNFFRAPRFDKKKAGGMTAIKPAGGAPNQMSPELWYWLAARHLDQQSPDFVQLSGSTDGQQPSLFLLA